MNFDNLTLWMASQNVSLSWSCACHKWKSCKYAMWKIPTERGTSGAFDQTSVFTGDEEAVSLSYFIPATIENLG